MKTIRSLALICLPLLSAGCGILGVPSRVSMPAVPMRTVLVSDRDSGAPLPSAQVTFEMWEHVNWLKPFPLETWGTYSRTNNASWEPHPTETWRATPLGNGLFRIDPRQRTGWAQVWFPIGLPLGGVLYRTYDGRVVARAPGYEGVWVSNTVADASEKAWHPRAQHAGPFRLEGHRVHILLRKDGSGHNNSVEGIGAGRAESSR